MTIYKNDYCVHDQDLVTMMTAIEKVMAQSRRFVNYICISTHRAVMSM